MVGIDIIEIARIAKAAEKESFLTKVFTPAELAYCKEKGGRAETLAGMFCAKEAAAKAAGQGIKGFRLNDIEVAHDKNGAPYLAFYNNAKTLFDQSAKVEISISHCNDYATAVCFVHNQ